VADLLQLRAVPNAGGQRQLVQVFDGEGRQVEWHCSGENGNGMELHMQLKVGTFDSILLAHETDGHGPRLGVGEAKQKSLAKEMELFFIFKLKNHLKNIIG
jgi:hypothetical protein